ncbi:hypothetical protein DFH08DRAFT_975022 [Mycena albidolilacea]|uniref:Uncharacterized protein n=1 Tax=Mycena albidolilacea TaxID=1033008 RepID=A0AAD6Z5D2_9AGAR|nr:hypothetical protein DFH08DRAFT_975022 [Mycena albidolilacea]
MSALRVVLRWVMSTKVLSMLSAVLHLILLAAHIVLYELSRRGLEKRLVFPLHSQTVVSFAITAITTAFGTVYYAALTFITQTLSTRRDLQTNQSLTATHDHAAAWAGIVAAFLRLWDQKAVTASIFGVLNVFLYLTNILVLHITTPALFSLEAFNSSVPTAVDTLGFPFLNFTRSNFDATTPNGREVIWLAFMDSILESLYFLPYIIRTNTNLGLLGGTLYDIPVERSEAPGTFSVNATGLNVTCGYLTPSNVTGGSPWNISMEGSPEVYEANLDFAGAINSSPGFLNSSSNFIDQNGLDIIFTTIASLPDSSGSQPPTVPVKYGEKLGLYPLGLFRCHVSSVTQTAVLDAQSLQIMSLEPIIVKTSSAWLPVSWTAQAPADLNDPLGALDVSLIDMWETVYRMAPSVINGLSGSVADLCFNQQIAHLSGAKTTFLPNNITLHLVENALSETLAAIFWTLGHLPRVTDVFDNGTNLLAIGLKPGHAVGTQLFTQLRLKLSTIAILWGLLASALLTLYSAKFSTYATPSADTREGIDGTGFLHAIWVFRNNPMLRRHLDQVHTPSEKNLRKAGMIKTRLADRANVNSASGSPGSQMVATGVLL